MSEENMTMRLELVGTDQASASIRAADESLTKFTETLKASQDTIRATAKAWTAGFESLVSSARAATTTATDIVGDMRKTIVGDLDTMRANMASTFAPLVDSAATATEAVTAGMARVDTVITETITQVRALAGELRTLKVPGVAAGEGSGMLEKAARRGRSGGGAHGGPRGIVKAGLGGLEAAGTMLMPFELNPVTGSLVVAGGGVYEAVTQKSEAARALLTGNYDPRKEIGMQVAEYQRHIQDQASAVNQSFGDVSESYMTGSRMMQSLKPEDRRAVIDSILPNASYESTMKGTSLNDAAQSMLELREQMGIYGKDDIKKMTGQFAVASLNANATLPQLTNQASYFLPQLRASLGLDFSSGMSAEVASMNAGLQRSGTSIRDFTESLFMKMGKGGAEHNAALARLGLFNPSDWQVRDKKTGKVDYAASWARAGEIAEQHTAGMSDTVKENVLKQAFGEQGGRFGSLLMTKAFRDQLSGIKGRVDAGAGDGDMLGQLRAADPLMQFKQDWLDLQSVLADVGTVVLPPLLVTLKGIDAILVTVHKGFEGLFDLFAKWTPSGPTMKPESQADKWHEMQRDHSQDGLRKQMSFTTWDDGVDRSNDDQLSRTIGMDAIARLWMAVYTDLHVIRGYFERPGRAISDNINGVAAGIVPASFETNDIADGGGGISANGLALGLGGRRLRGGLDGYNDTSGGSEGRAPTGSLLARGTTLMAKLMAGGVTKEAAAAIAGNFQQESGITPNGVSGDHGTAHGLAQWRFDRFAGLKAFAAKMNKPWTDLDAQVGFFLQEVKQRGHAGWLYGHSVEAANEGMKNYERFGDHSGAARLANARRWNNVTPEMSDVAEHVVRNSNRSSTTIHAPVHIHGAKDPKAVAHEVTAHLERSFNDRTHDVDFDV